MRQGKTWAALTVLVLSASMLPLASEGSGLDPDTQFYVPKPNHGAKTQMADLISNGDKADAGLIKAMIETPQAVWFTAGTPKKVQQDVKKTAQLAAGKGSVPVLVAYNIPFRNCGQFSAGGATAVEEYEDWIDGFAAGIGDREVVVVLEPDGLGIIPYYTNLDNNLEWCQPPGANPATAA